MREHVQRRRHCISALTVSDALGLLAGLRSLAGGKG